MSQRFVIQLHATSGGAHYDLMLQQAGGLATWRLARPPVRLGPHDEIAACRLPDHRLAYLTYQGPVSRGRGTVRICDAGTFRLIARSEAAWVFALRGRLVRGTFTLRRLGRAHWKLSRVRRGRREVSPGPG